MEGPANDSWRLRVSFKGRRCRIDLGANHEGWNEDRALVELERIIGEIERGTWKPPQPKIEEPEDETIHLTVSRFLAEEEGRAPFREHQGRHAMASRLCPCVSARHTDVDHRCPVGR